MANYVPAPPDPGQAMMLNLFAQGMQNFGQGWRGSLVKDDMSAFAKYLQDLQNAQSMALTAQGAQNWLADTSGFLGMPEFQGQAPALGPAPVAPPVFKTSEGEEAMLQFQLGRMPDPYRTAQLENVRSETALRRAQMAALQNPEAAPMAGRPMRLQEGNEYDLPTGTVIQFDANKDMKILWQPQPTKAADIVRQTFQAPDGTWRVGLFSPMGELHKDLGPAPPSMIGGPGPSVDEERAKRIQELRSMPGPLTREQQTELNAMLIPGASAGPTRDDQEFYTQRGFAQDEADAILGIRYGLQPRATTTGGTQADLNRWLSIYTKSRFDPIWGQSIPELANVTTLAQGQIDKLTAQMREGEGAKPLSRDALVRELLALKTGNRRVVERVPTAKLMMQYPVLASQLPTLSQEELEGVLSAIESGMTEAEILRFFTGAGGTQTPGVVQ